MFPQLGLRKRQSQNEELATPTDRFLRRMLWLGVGLIVLAVFWFVAGSYLINLIVPKPSGETLAYYLLFPSVLICVVGLLLIAFRVNHWLYEFSGLPNWWDKNP